MPNSEWPYCSFRQCYASPINDSSGKNLRDLLQWGSDGHNAAAAASSGSKFGESKSGSNGASVSGVTKSGSAKCSNGAGVCSCPASTVTGYAPTGSAGMIPMAPTICNISLPTPEIKPLVPPPTTAITINPPTPIVPTTPMIVPFTPAIVPLITPPPTPCNEQRFFLVNGVCMNDVFMMKDTSYGSAMECCNVNMENGSMISGTCSYVDTCNPQPLSTPHPTPCEGKLVFFDGSQCSNEFYICNTCFRNGSFLNGCQFIDSCNPQPLVPPPTPSPSSGSTPTVSTEVTGPPTVAGREYGVQDADEQ